jgi:hypothetical protein
MSDINVERREPGIPWWAWLLGAFLLLLILWWIVAATTRDRVAQVPAERDPAVQAPARDPWGAEGPAATAALPLTGIGQNPAAYHGEVVSGTAVVPEVISDRAFWVESAGERIMAVLDDGLPSISPQELSGQQVHLQAHVFDSARLDRVPADRADAQTQQMVVDQPVFLHVMELHPLTG